MDPRTEAALRELTDRLTAVGGVEAIWVGGSLATGDHVPGVSDLDLVAITDRPVTGTLLDAITAIHRSLDADEARGLDLGCQYVDVARLTDLDAEHPTWTHGDLVERNVSLVTRVELALHGVALAGPSPGELLPPDTARQVRLAAQLELTGYWTRAARRPWMFVRLPVMVDLGLTSMARARHSIRTGELLTKSAAIERAAAPEWLKDQLRARRRGEDVASPVLRAGLIAWRDVRRTTAPTRLAPPGAQA